MGHAALENLTPFTFETLYVTDEALQPLLVTVVKATYELHGSGLRLAEEQAPLHHGGILQGGQEDSSYRYEPEVAFFKPATDVVLVGHAQAPSPDTRELKVALQVGPLRKVVQVFGERVWFKSLGQASMTRPQPFERIPLCYERAFGGWDRSHPEASRHAFEARNPVGVGFRAHPRHFEEGLRLPNLEDPKTLLRSFGQVVAPAGFGFVSPHWHPRARLAGTYDEAWATARAPLLPRDFDRRFFNAASPGLVANGYLRGDEAVSLENASPAGRLGFRLPGPLALRVRVVRTADQDVWLEPRLDTLIIDTDAGRVFLLWRAQLPLQEGPHEVRSLHLRSERP
ncbi:DUF2169 domain-containing protein [Corallococcus sp. BB11-1]|uniref:DUF2169 family type VI secretion system accessory protein n=1 Tax=Corallococcus sp. BB11-1 TaxID=2996783 RepID=UPI00226E7383|nr:DUF2169 domain-containing protein [Corallococcus sp. BB11-1]MCY1031919.1 DUF2169 domain-containing protein [Corallococcus sp. BB11-1]